MTVNTPYRRVAMRRIWSVVMLVGLVALGAGCALLSSPTPTTNVSVRRGAENARGDVVDADVITMPEQWASGWVRLVLDEEFQDAGEGREAMKRRQLTIERKSDNAIAGEVALERAFQTRGAADDGGRVLGEVLSAAIQHVDWGGVLTTMLETGLAGRESRDRANVDRERIRAELEPVEE